MPARRSISQRRCTALAKIVNGTPAVVNRTCLIQTLRSDIKPRIQGRRTRSPLVLPVFFSVEKSKGKKRTLNLGEAVLRQREVNKVISGLRKRGITVTALHNHWLFERPRLMYMHWQAAMEPKRFLRASRAALRAAGVKTRPL